MCRLPGHPPSHLVYLSDKRVQFAHRIARAGLWQVQSAGESQG